MKKLLAAFFAAAMAISFSQLASAADYTQARSGHDGYTHGDPADGGSY